MNLYWGAVKIDSNLSGGIILKKKALTSALIALLLSSTTAAGGVNLVQAAGNNHAQSFDFSLPLDNHQQFIQQIAPVAKNAAKQYGLYPSVMMAQAILESDWGTSSASQAPNYNYFGIKGDYNGSAVQMATQEWSPESDYYTINSSFRRYPSMKASFADNGNLLRSDYYYSGTWRENASTYRDATAWLQGRYATDPEYANKLNQLIKTYNLTQYDGTADNTAPTTTTNTANKQTAKLSSDRGRIKLYSPLGVALPSSSLKPGATCTFGETRYINGQRFYRVSTYEWLNADDVVAIN
ncbi:MAG: glycoside hydrolase family 73 protein [Lactobacillus sp.]|nr:glycoside hydrolase family 73 protein [Lactobacillus sp.]